MNNTMGVTPTLPLNAGYNDGLFGGDGAIWLLVILALFGGFGGYGMGGFGGFGGFGGMYEFPWLLTGQQGINNNTNAGFDNLHLSNQIEGVRDGIAGLSNQVCNSTADVVAAVNGGFANAEIAANSRQIANMNQAFNSEIATLNGFNNINNALQNCCCENRLATCQTQNTIQSEGNATRFADANNTRDIIDAQTRGTQAILDKLCQLELDNVKAQLEAKNDLIDQLRQENLYARGQASQIQQTADLKFSNAEAVDSLYTRLSNCPVPSTPVYGRTPIFTCNNGCGCGGFNTTSQFI